MKLTTKLSVLLAVIVMFSQCHSAFMSRKYTKGHYHESKEKLAAKTVKSSSIELSHPEAASNGDIALKTTEPETKVSEPVAIKKTAPLKSNIKPNKITLNETDKQKEEAIAEAPAVKKLNYGKEEFRSMAKASFKAGFKKAFTEPLNHMRELKKKKNADVPRGVTMGLSIGAFACGLGALLLMFYGIIDSLVYLYVSPYFFIAMVLGVVGIALGITTLALGHGDLESMEKSFSILGIALGGAGLIFAGLWYMIMNLAFASS